MAVARYLLDTSATAREHHAEVSERLRPLFERGEVATCSILELEAVRSARNAEDAIAVKAEHAGLERVAIEQRDFDHAVDVLISLARRGHHRAVGIADLIIAAVAQRAALTVMHYDTDFETIASVTGQPAEWVVPRGSVP